MHDGGAAGVRQRRRERVPEPIERGELAGPARIELLLEPPQLALEVSGWATERAEPDPLVVQPMKRRERMEQLDPAGVALGQIEVIVRRRADNAPVDVVHHVERCADYLIVLACGDDPRNRHVAPVQRVKDAPLARHAVRGRQPATKWRAPQDPLAFPRSEQIGEVRSPAGDQLRVEWGLLVENIESRSEPGAQRVGIQARRRGSLRDHHMSAPGTGFPSRRHLTASRTSAPPSEKVWISEANE